MAQLASPSEDTLIGNFTDQLGGTTDIWETISEEEPSDAEYIQSPASPVDEVYVTKLSSITDPEVSTGHALRMRTSADQDDQEPIDFLMELREGYVNEGDQGTLIASVSRLGVDSTEWTTTSYNLSGAEADAITDYADLYLRFVVSVGA
jgi:hypothetical protein